MTISDGNRNDVRANVWLTAIECPKDAEAEMHDLSDRRYRQYLFVHSGGGLARLEGWRTSLAGGEIAFIPAGSQAHVMLEGGTKSILFGVADDFLLSRVVPALGVSIASYWHDFHSPKKLSHWIGRAGAEDRNRLWNELRQAGGRLGTASDGAVAAYILLTLFEKNNNYNESNGELFPISNSADEMSGSELDIVNRFRGLIDENLASDWQIADYCEALDVRPAQLVQACKALLGSTPVAVIQAQKILHAKRKLAYSRASAAEISYQLGFEDPAYFSRFFRKRTGTTPVQFRKSQRTFAVYEDPAGTGASAKQR
jgi:AraC family transcriptional activator of pobA